MLNGQEVHLLQAPMSVAVIGAQKWHVILRIGTEFVAERRLRFFFQVDTF